MAFSICSSTKIVLTSLLLEQVQLLKGLQSVDSEDEVAVLRHAETSHGILELNVVEDDGGDVVGILLGKSLIWSSLDLLDQLIAVVQNCFSDLFAETSGSLVSLCLRVAHSE